MRHVAIGILIYLTLLADLHQPTWGLSRIHLGFLDVGFLLVTLFSGVVGAIAWGGLIGLLTDVVYSDALGLGIVVHTTLAWAISSALIKQWAQSMFAKSGLCLMALTLLTVSRAGFFWESATPEVMALITGRVAITFLAVLIILSLASLFQRDHAKMAH